MMKAAFLLTVLMLGGCVSGSGSQVNGAAPAGTTREEDEAYRTRQRCQSTAEGTETKTVCY